MKVARLLTEATVDLSSPSQREEYADEVWKMIQMAYKHVGTGGADISDLVQTPGVWRLIMKDGQLVGGAIYRNHNGLKLRLIFHNGTPNGKQSVIQMMANDIFVGRAWGEFSGQLERVMMRLGARPVSNMYASKLLGKRVKEMDKDGYHYLRDVGNGNIKREIILGNPTKY
ncbi:MAG: hypothetical protein E4H14_08820 [Candidatus Thorarchaeota archaeon]|nr:MAG: hypothetical protein E4H14_08820 [Candidatus Thorarchaeota archaeon]